MTEDKARLPIGLSDFKELVVSNCQIVDKSPFIKEIVEDASRVILITRPRRFGKTLNLSMLRYFLQNNGNSNDHNLFENLAISKYTDFCLAHQNKYPLIFISFKDVKASTYKDAYSGISLLLSELYREHRYLLEEGNLDSAEKENFLAMIKQETTDNTQFANSIKKLAELAERKFQVKPIILIDEYDTPIQSSYLEGYYEEMIELMRRLLGSSLKDNSALSKAVLTGITRISQESLFSGLNNIKVYSLLNEKYGQYFGFSEEEVIKLKNEAGLEELPLEDIKNWYNGYRIRKYTLYNPWSIINCLSNKGELAPYWLNTSSNDLVRVLVSNADYSFKKDFEKLLQGDIIEKPIFENLVFPELKTTEEAIWSLLLYAGYLNVLQTEIRTFQTIAQICIPNREVMYIYDGIIAGWFRRNSSLDSYIKFTKSLKEGDINDFKRYIGEMLELGSYFDFNKNTPESVFHSFMLGLTVGLKDEYIIKSNIESGKGRFDVAFIPKTKERHTKHQGIVLEFKTAESEDLLASKAREALMQIKDREYTHLLKQHEVTKVLAIGLAFCGKKVEAEYEEVGV